MLRLHEIMYRACPILMAAPRPHASAHARHSIISPSSRLPAWRLGRVSLTRSAFVSIRRPCRAGPFLRKTVSGARRLFRGGACSQPESWPAARAGHCNRRSAALRPPRSACAPSGSRPGRSARRRSASRLEAVNGVPVRLAEVFKGLPGSRRAPAAGSQHHAPVGGGELSVLPQTWWMGVCGRNHEG
jgi:hypothetical protein